jgi:hypothetical protein
MAKKYSKGMLKLSANSGNNSILLNFKPERHEVKLRRAICATTATQERGNRKTAFRPGSIQPPNNPVPTSNWR